MMQTSRQLQHPLLCLECENALNVGGEGWLLPLLATIDKKFPLLDIIERFDADVIDGDTRGYAASRNPAIEVDKLIHFIMGVFWKASIHSWRGDDREPMIDLGPYGERVRTFLRGETPFPANMGLVVAVLPREKAVISFNAPYRGSAQDSHNFVFYIPGVQTVLSVGKRLPAEMPAICFATNPLHPLLVADMSSDVLAMFRSIGAKAHKPKKLLAHFQSLERKRRPY
jgi:hypothetical protein